MKEEEPAPPLERASRWILWLIVVSAVVPFLNGLPNDFTYDDKIIIRDNPRLAAPGSALSVFSTHYFGGSLSTGQNYRPVVLLTYAAERWVHGNRPSLFRAVNIALHALVCLLAYFWILRLGMGSSLAAAASLWFAAAAVHVEAVTSLVGRAEVLAAVLVLASALSWLRATASERVLRGPYFLCLLFFLLAVFVKESAVVVPGVVLLGEFFRQGRSQGRVRSLMAAVWVRRWWLSGLLFPLFILFVVRLAVLEGFLLSRHAGIFEVENPLVATSAPLRVLNGFVLLGRYALTCLFPFDLAADHSAYSLRLLSRADGLLILLALGAGVAVLLSILAAWRRVPAFSFGLLLFVGTLFPASNIPFPIGTIYAERLVYLPSLGVFLAALSLFQPRGWAVPRLSRVKWGELGVTLLVVVNALVTVSRNRVWKDDTSLFTDMVAKRPGSAKARYNLGYDLYRRQRLDEAARQLETAIEVFPRHYDAFTLLGRIHRERGDLPRSIRAYQKAVEIFPGYERAVLGFSGALMAAGRTQEAERTLRSAALRTPQSAAIASARARHFETTGEWKRAFHEWRRARILDRGSAESRAGLARALQRAGRAAEAREEARWALWKDPSKIEARFVLSEIYEEEGKFLPACVELARAWRSDRGNPVTIARLNEFLERHPELHARALGKDAGGASGAK